MKTTLKLRSGATISCIDEATAAMDNETEKQKSVMFPKVPPLIPAIPSPLRICLPAV